MVNIPLVFTLNKIIEKLESLKPASLFVDVSSIDSYEEVVQNEEDFKLLDGSIAKSNEDLIYEFLGHQELPDYIKQSVLYKMIGNLIKIQEN